MFMLLMVFVVLSVVLSVAVTVLVKGNRNLKAQLSASDSVTAELKQKVATLERLSAEKSLELEEATASEFALKAKLDNTVTNYKKLETYSVSGAKRSNNKKFDDCLFEDDYIMEIEKELGIQWFK